MLRGTSSLLRLSTRAVLKTSSCSPVSKLPKASASNGILRQIQSARPMVWRTQYSTIPPNQIDKEHEKKVAQQKLEARPEEVSTQSSVRHFLESDQTKTTKVTDEDVEEVGGDLKKDIQNVVDTIALDQVPRNAYRLGLAGTVPYVFTSLSTVYLSWNLNTQWPTDNQLLNSFMVSNATAKDLLQMLEPIQLGYGAVIISFLGAIHWGMELAEKKPDPGRTRFRYLMGVAAPAVAWPTLLLPIEWALTGQFAAFIGLYFADARATTNGWVPGWYATYRWVLTAIVGGSIVVSLIGRFKVGEEGKALSTQGLRDSMKKSTVGGEPYANWAHKEDLEKERLHKEKEKKRKEEEAKKKEEEAEKRKKAEKKLDEKEGKEEKGDGESDDKKEGKQEKAKGKSDDKKEGKEEKGDGESDDKKEEKEDKGDGESDDKKEGKQEKANGEGDDKKEKKEKQD